MTASPNVGKTPERAICKNEPAANFRHTGTGLHHLSASVDKVVDYVNGVVVVDVFFLQDLGGCYFLSLGVLSLPS